MIHTDINHKLPFLKAQKLSKKDMFSFSRESNDIEGISQNEANQVMIGLLEDFIYQDGLTVTLVEKFALGLGDHCLLRRDEGMDVKVGGHFPPKGGIRIERVLVNLLSCLTAKTSILSPYEVYQEFERLHPLMDGNGRLGRAIWLHQMLRWNRYAPSLGFLKTYHYQSFDSYRGLGNHG